MSTVTPTSPGATDGGRVTPREKQLTAALDHALWLLERATPIRRGNGARAAKASDAWYARMAKLDAAMGAIWNPCPADLRDGAKDGAR